VIVRGLNLKGAKADAIRISPTVTDVVIEDNDISGWGRTRDGKWGADMDAAVRAEAIEHDAGRMRFRARRPAGAPLEVTLNLPGRHNVLNATAALVCALEMGFTADTIAPALAGYRGVGRRFERRGTSHGVTFVDDYAHLPAKCAAALASAEQGRARHGHDGWTRVVAVFQPHRYSRTEALGPEFADSFVGADVLVITDIYGAGEAPRPGVTSAVIIDAVRAAHPGQRIVPVTSLADAAEYLAGELRPGDLCLSLGAGDVTTLPDLVRERMGPG